MFGTNKRVGKLGARPPRAKAASLLALAAPAAAVAGKDLTPAEIERAKLVDIGLALLCREWLGGILSVEANRILPGILVKIYSAQLRGALISKREACAPLRIDPTTTGARYISMAEEHGLIAVERREANDGRKGFLSVTPKGIALIERDLQGISELLGRAAVEAAPVESRSTGDVLLPVPPYSWVERPPEIAEEGKPQKRGYSRNIRITGLGEEAPGVRVKYSAGSRVRLHEGPPPNALRDGKEVVWEPGKLRAGKRRPKSSSVQKNQN